MAMDDSTIEQAPGEWLTVFRHDGDGRPGTSWWIEQDPEGYLCITTRTVTRRRINSAFYPHGADPAVLREDLRDYGMPEIVIDRYLSQAGLE
jgi:hypothetical protein